MSVSMNVMLAVHGKRADPVDLVGPIKQYVTQTFSDREASDAADDLQAVQQMRDDIVAASNSMEARVELLPKYYAALCVMEVRFPISKEKGHINKVSFSWHDAFKPTKRVALPNIHLEKAAIVFNLATVHSHIALGADRTSADGLKIAAKNFQLSAGAFAFLREHLAMKLPAGTSPDLSTECAAMMERLMLAQAQECVFEKALADKKSAGVCAKLAAQIGLYYEEAHAMVSLPPLDAYMDKVWTTHLQLKAAQFHAEALLRMAMSHREQEDVAPEIARLTAASQILQAAKKKARGQGSPPLMDAVDKLEAAVTRGLDVAHRENNSIYLVRIPSNDALPPLGATSLVKSAPIGEELAARAKESRLFCKLVPDTSAKALSKYTEMVDDAIRLELEAMQKESDEARLCLKQWDLPDMLLALDKVPPGGRAALPEPLFKEVEHMSALGGVVALREIWAQIVDLRSVNEEMLESAVKLLDDEEKDDDNMRQQFKERWNRPKSAELTKNLRDKAKSFRDNMRVAAESDASLQRKMAENGDAFGRLSRPEELSPPRLSKPMVSLAGNEDAIAVGLQHLLVELDKLSKERAGLEEALQEMKQKDNILPRLMSTSESYDALFQQELKKYEPLRSEVSRNISSAQALLRQIEAQQEAFVRTYQVAEWKESVSRWEQDLRGGLRAFKEVHGNLSEGMRYYTAIQDSIKAYKQQCGDFVMTRKLQRDDMLEAFTKMPTTHATRASPAPTQAAPPAATPAPGGYQQPGGPPQSAYGAAPHQSRYPPGGGGYGPPPMSGPPAGVYGNPYAAYGQPDGQMPPPPHYFPPPPGGQPGMPPQGYQQAPPGGQPGIPPQGYQQQYGAPQGGGYGGQPGYQAQQPYGGASYQAPPYNQMPPNQPNQPPQQPPFPQGWYH